MCGTRWVCVYQTHHRQLTRARLLRGDRLWPSRVSKGESKLAHGVLFFVLSTQPVLSTFPYVHNVPLDCIHRLIPKHLHPPVEEVEHLLSTMGLPDPCAQYMRAVDPSTHIGLPAY